MLRLNRVLILRQILTVALLLSTSAVGCVQRRMTVRTNVPGAQVYVDNTEIGRTPVSTDFIYYGDRTIRLVKDGYETQIVKQPVNAPWYQWPGLDFFAENVWPFEIRDERQFNYQLQPQYIVPTETLLSRGEELRRTNAAAVALPTPAIAGPATTGPQPVSTPGIIAPPAFLTPPQTTTPPPAMSPPQSAAQPALPGYPSTSPNPYVTPGR